MNTLLLGLGTKNEDNSYETQALHQALVKQGHSVVYALWNEITFIFENNKDPQILVRNKPVNNIDCVIPRYPLSSSGFPHNPKPGKVYLSRLYTHFLLLVEYMSAHNAYVLNQDVRSVMTSYDKLLQHFILNKAHIPIIPSYCHTNHITPQELYQRFQKPFVVKSIDGSRGRSVHKISSKKELSQIIDQYGQGNFLTQQHIPYTKDYRVVVLGNKVVGGIERKPLRHDDFRANVDLGATPHQAQLNTEIKNIALQTSSVFKAEFAGVDILEYQKKYFVLEINIFPMFQGFDSATHLSVADLLITHLEGSVKAHTSKT